VQRRAHGKKNKSRVSTQGGLQKIYKGSANTPF